MDLNLFSRRDRDLFSFVAWIATFYYPWLGGFFEFVFSEGPRPFFLCSLKSYVLLPVVGWIFWICFTQRTELWVYGEAIISQGCFTFYLPGGTRSLNFLSFEVLRFYYPWLGGFFEFVFSEGLRPFLPLIVAWIAVFYYPWLGWFFYSAFFGRPEIFILLETWILIFVDLPRIGSIDWLNDLIKLVVIRIICFF